MRRVDITEDVCLKGGIHGYQAEAAHDFGMVGNLAGTHKDLVTEEVDIIHKVQHGIVRECERACRSELTFALFHKVHDSVLDNLGIHFKTGYLWILAQTVEHGICHIAHTALDRQEFLRHLSVFKLRSQETAHIVTDFLRNLVSCCKGMDALRSVRRHYAHYLFRIYLQHGRADAVRGAVDGDLATVRGIQGNVVIMEASERGLVI